MKIIRNSFTLIIIGLLYSLSLSAQGYNITRKDYKELMNMQLMANTTLISNATNGLSGSISLVGKINSEDFSLLQNIQALSMRYAHANNIIPSFAFKDNTKLNRFVCPTSTKEIMPNSFNGASALETIVIGDNVKKIGPYAFRGCSNLKYIYVEWSNKIANINKKAFEGVNVEEIVLFIPIDSKEMYKKHRIFRKFKHAIYAPGGLTPDYKAPLFGDSQNLRESIQNFYQYIHENIDCYRFEEELVKIDKIEEIEVYFSINMHGEVEKVVVISPFLKGFSGMIEDALYLSPHWQPATYFYKPASSLTSFKIIITQPTDRKKIGVLDNMRIHIKNLRQSTI